MKSDEIRSGKARPKPVTRPIPWKKGDPTPPDVYDDCIVIMLNGEPVELKVIYDGELKYNIGDEEELMWMAVNLPPYEKEVLRREALDPSLRPVPWTPGDPFPPDVYNDFIVVMYEGVPIWCVVGYNGKVKYDLTNEDEIVEVVECTIKRITRELKGLPPEECNKSVAESLSESLNRELKESMHPGILAARAAIAACPEGTPYEQKLAIGKAAAFAAGFAGTSVLINQLKRIFGGM